MNGDRTLLCGVLESERGVAVKHRRLFNIDDAGKKQYVCSTWWRKARWINPNIREEGKLDDFQKISSHQDGTHKHGAHQDDTKTAVDMNRPSTFDVSAGSSEEDDRFDLSFRSKVVCL